MWFKFTMKSELNNFFHDVEIQNYNNKKCMKLEIDRYFSKFRS